MRLAVYTDYVYRQVDDIIYADRAFALFLAPIAAEVERMVLIGRLSPIVEAEGYALPPELKLAPLRHYGSLANPAAALWSLIGSCRQLWRSLDKIDVLWVLGPYPHAVVLALLAWARRRTVVLGVRQDWPRYVRMRRPGRRLLHVAADAMEWIWRALARRFPVVAVGSELGANYAHAPAVLELAVSLVPASAIAAAAPWRDYESELVILSVGRLEEEKNPMLLADILARLQAADARWHLRVVGVGELAASLARRAQDLGVAERLELLGYVPMGEALLDLYRTSHAFLHVSWTEGFPQVLIEAFAAGLPTVATAVGGVAPGVGDGALLIKPGDAEAAATALERLVRDPELRHRLTAAGLRRARELTLEAQTARLLSFLTAAERRAAITRRAAS